jgi:DNA-binding transcriptional ArsR family regulator
MVEYSHQLDSTYSALADPSRRAILHLLRKGSMRITEIAEPFHVSLNAISKHVKVLERAGLIRRSVEGREHWLTLNPTPLVAASDWIEDYRAYWEQRLDALEAFLTEENRNPDAT